MIEFLILTVAIAAGIYHFYTVSELELEIARLRIALLEAQAEAAGRA